VDATVGKELVEQCICGLLAGRGATVVLVTHQLQFLSWMDKVLLLDDGGIMVGLGTVDQLKREGHTFETGHSAVEDAASAAAPDLTSGGAGDAIASATASSVAITASAGAVPSKQAAVETSTRAKRSTVHVAESREEGVVTSSTYTTYLKSGASAATMYLLLLFFAAVQVCEIMTAVVLERWVDNNERNTGSATADANATAGASGGVGSSSSSNSNSGDVPLVDGSGSESGESGFLSDVLAGISTTAITAVGGGSSSGDGGGGDDDEWYIRTYSIMVAALIVIAFARTIWFMARAVRSSRALHSMALDGTVASPMRFFDSNPVGRVLNRFSKDTGLVDDMLPPTALEVIQGTMQITGAVVVACSINAFVILIVVPLVVVFFFMRRYFLKSSREVKRVSGERSRCGAVLRLGVLGVLASWCLGVLVSWCLGVLVS
jgi:ATP-binding cassette subfamily C (CFTR/MRP) protein 4